MTFSRSAVAAAVVVLASPLAPALAQSSLATHADSRGNSVKFPLGEVSFADDVVAFAAGTPKVRDARWGDPKLALGAPDYVSEKADERTQTAVSLGCGGVLVFRFADNALVDVPGPDLYVFEVGPVVEAMGLAISPDGEHWTDVGSISGGTAHVDIANAAKPGATYRYVRLTDLKSGCGGGWPGADVDAVGAIGSTLDLSFDAAVLFDVDASVLKPEARTALAAAAKTLARYPGAAITVGGHTDSTGTAERNLLLSQARADAVRTFLATRPELQGRTLAAKGFGATRPVASNATDGGRQRNRRVEIVGELPR